MGVDLPKTLAQFSHVGRPIKRLLMAGTAGDFVDIRSNPNKLYRSAVRMLRKFVMTIGPWARSSVAIANVAGNDVCILPLPAVFKFTIGPLVWGCSIAMPLGSVLFRFTLSACPWLLIVISAGADDGPGVLRDLFDGGRLADCSCALASSPTIMLMVRVLPGITLS